MKNCHKCCHMLESAHGLYKIFRKKKKFKKEKPKQKTPKKKQQEKENQQKIPTKIEKKYSTSVDPEVSISCSTFYPFRNHFLMCLVFFCFVQDVNPCMLHEIYCLLWCQENP